MADIDRFPPRGPLKVIAVFYGAEDALSVGEEFARTRRRVKYERSQDRKAEAARERCRARKAGA